MTEQGAGGGADKGDSMAPQSRGEFEPKADLLQQLVNMGIDVTLASRALYYTGNYSVELAASWIYENEDRSDSSEEDAVEDFLAASDFYKMVFVVNTELNMGVGKVAAQVAHAALGLFRQMWEEQDKYAAMIMQWEQFGETKIVLKGENTGQLKHLAGTATSIGLPNYIVQDAGRTQIAAGSTTALAIMGKVDLVDQVTGTLKLL